MKKITSLVVSAIGIAAAAWMIFSIVHFGATNMRRVEAQSIQYKMSWASRR